MRSDQASLYQHCDRDVPSSRAAVPSVTGFTASQILKVSDLLVALLHHSNRIVDGAIEFLWRKQSFGPVTSLSLKTSGCVFVCV